jgi:hypothetical protein
VEHRKGQENLGLTEARCKTQVYVDAHKDEIS